MMKMIKGCVVAFPVLVAGLLGASACVAAGTTGSGHVRSETRNVAGFDSIDLRGEGSLTIRQTGVESLTIATDDNVLPLVHSDVAGGVLSLGPESTGMVRVTQLSYTLTVKSLKAISVHGDATVSAAGIHTPALAVTMDGDSRVQVAGQAQSQDVTINGSGRYDASGLVNRTANVDVNGGGNAVVNVSDRLGTSVNPGAGVQYIGHPTVINSGLGKVARRG
jgi:hypothetical protein